MFNFYKLAVGLPGLAGIVYGAGGIVTKRLSSGEGELGNGPLAVDRRFGGFVGVVCVLFGAYLVYIALMAKGP